MTTKADLITALRSCADGSGDIPLRIALGTTGGTVQWRGETKATGQAYNVPGFLDCLLEAIASVVDTQVAAAIASAAITSEFATLAAPDTTTSGSLVNITGLSQSITLQKTGRIVAVMLYTCSSTGAGADATAGHAVQIDGADGGENQRYLMGGTDVGVGAVMGRSASLGAGSYTVNGRHRRVSGLRTVSTDLAQLLVLGPLAG